MNSTRRDHDHPSAAGPRARGGGRYWVPIITGILLAALVAWIGAVTLIRTGHYYDGTVTRMGSAEVSSCRTNVLLLTKCAASVRWDDGKEQTVDVLTPRTLGGGQRVAVEQHPHKENWNTVQVERPVTMTKDFPSGQNGTPLKILLALGTLIAFFAGLVGAGLILGRINRRRATPR